MNEVVDLTACLARGKTIKVENKEYEIKFGFRALLSLEEQYDSIDKAIDCFIKRRNLFNDILNFLYAALGEKYKLNKTDIEEWISISTVNILYDVIFEALLQSFGKGDGDSKQGEA